jgi:hypothetical protein
MLLPNERVPIHHLGVAVQPWLEEPGNLLGFVLQIGVTLVPAGNPCSGLTDTPGVTRLLQVLCRQLLNSPISATTQPVTTTG